MTIYDFISLVSMGLVLASSFAAVYWMLRKYEWAPSDHLFSVAWKSWGIWLFSNLVVLMAFVVLELKRIIPPANSFWKILLVLTAMFAFSTFAEFRYLGLLIRRLDRRELSVVPVEVVRSVPKPSALNIAFLVSIVASLAIVLVLIAAQSALSGYRYYFPPPKTTFTFYDS